MGALQEDVTMEQRHADIADRSREPDNETF